MAEPFTEIQAALWNLRRVFEKHHMTPTILELADPRQSRYLKAMLDPATIIAIGMDLKGNPTRQIEIEGIIVRWPAQMLPVGEGFVYVDPREGPSVLLSPMALRGHL